MNLTALEREIAKTEQKIEEYREKVRRLKQRKTDEENAQFIKLVRIAELSVAELKRLLKPEEPVRIPGKEMEEESNV